MASVDEILVHISGPSTRKDDHRYQAMARAYAAFEPVKRLEVLDVDGESHNLEVEELATSGVAMSRVLDQLRVSPTSSTLSELSRRDSETLTRSREDFERETSVGVDQSPLGTEYTDDTQLARAAIVSQSWTESLGEREDGHSFSLLSPLVEIESKCLRHHSLRPSLSSDHFLTANTQTTGHVDRPQPPPILNASIEQTGNGHEVTSCTGPTNSAGIDNCDIDQVRCPLITAGKVGATPTVKDEKSEEAEHILFGINPSPGRTGTLEIPANSAEKDLFVVAKSPVVHALATVIVGDASLTAGSNMVRRDSSEAQIITDIAASASLSIVSSQISPRDITGELLSSSIMPACPTVSFQSAPSSPESTSIVPHALGKLNLSDALISVYKPLLETRDIRPFERGYWSFNMTGLDLQTSEATWSFLTKFIKKGHGGWGLSCARDQLPQIEGPTLDQLRLYTWGCTVPHGYRLLYVASKSKIKRCRQVEWIDAEGKAVVRVGAE